MDSRYLQKDKEERVVSVGTYQDYLAVGSWSTLLNQFLDYYLEVVISLI